jgi:hypothetical protein
MRPESSSRANCQITLSQTVPYGTVPYRIGRVCQHLDTVRDYWPSKKLKVRYDVRARGFTNVPYVPVLASRCRNILSLLYNFVLIMVNVFIITLIVQRH